MKKQNPLSALAALVVVISFAACATIQPTIEPEPASQPDTAEAEPVPPPSYKNWTRISQQPSSFIPRGMPKETPTDHLSGEWVQTQDGNTRWFIPKDGIEKRSADELRSEAYSMRMQADESSLAKGRKRPQFREKPWASLLRRPADKTAEEDEP